MGVPIPIELSVVMFAIDLNLSAAVDERFNKDLDSQFIRFYFNIVPLLIDWVVVPA
jgi:hypothetical protein